MFRVEKKQNNWFHPLTITITNYRQENDFLKFMWVIVLKGAIEIGSQGNMLDYQNTTFLCISCRKPSL